MDKKQLRTIMFTGAATALLLVGVNIAVHRKPHPKSTLPRNICAESAYKKYASERLQIDKFTLNQRPDQSTIPQYLSIRRLQESFCLELLACTSTDSPSNSQLSLNSIAFENCVKDEENSDEQDAGDSDRENEQQ
jgi:hypothetical protein